MRADRSVTVTVTAAEPYIAHHPQPLHQRIVYPPNNRLHVIHPHSSRLQYWGWCAVQRFVDCALTWPGSLLTSDRDSNNNQYRRTTTQSDSEARRTALPPMRGLRLPYRITPLGSSHGRPAWHGTREACPAADHVLFRDI